MSYCSSNSTVMSSRKIKRLESKKRKAAAFLELVKGRPDSKVVEWHSSSTKSSTTGVTERDFQEKSDKKEGTGEMMAASGEQSSMETVKNPDDDVLMEMKRLVRERKKQAMQKIKVFLTLQEMVPYRIAQDAPLPPEEIPPLFVMDLQHLLLYGMQGNMASYKPRWCKLLRVNKLSSVVLILLNGVSYTDFVENKDCFPYTSAHFPSCVEMVSPQQYGKTVDEELYNVPLSVSQLKKKNFKVPEEIKKCVAAKISQPVPPGPSTKTDSFSRTCLLLSPFQMIMEGYPLPVNTKDGTYKGFVFTKDKYKKVTASSPLFAVDCEMCVTTAHKNELTRVSVVSEKGEILLDSLVKPWNRITNYVTRFSGITKEMLAPVTTRLADVQKKIRELLPADAILCGQSLNGDLLALKMFHPYVIDTSIIFNMSGDRRTKTGLRKLTQFFLDRTIQSSVSGHCSTEDATATLDLVKLKLSKGLEFGDATLNGVYFPNIRTYFVGGRSGVAENVEQDQETAQDSTNSSSVSVNGGEKNRTSTVKPEISTPASTFKKRDSSSDSEDSGAENFSVKKSGKEGECEPSSAKKRKVGNSDSSLNSECPGSASEDGDGKDNLNIKSTSEFVKEQQDFMFDQDNSVHVSHSIFRLIHEAGRSACLIDRAPTIERYCAEPIDKVTALSDTEACRAAKVMVQSKEFVWAQFHEYDTLLNSENASSSERQSVLQKLDHRIHKVVKKAKPSSLVIVAMVGGQQAHQNMATLLQTT